MNIFEIISKRSLAIKQYILSEEPTKLIIGIEEECHLTKGEGDKLVDLVRDILLGLVPTDDLLFLVKKFIPDDNNASLVEKMLQQSLVYRFRGDLNKTSSDVANYKQNNKWPEKIAFDFGADAPPPKFSSAANRFRPVPTTSDIRRPIKRVVPPATPVRPTTPLPSPTVVPRPSGAPPSGGGMPKLDQFQLRTVDDLINVPPAALAKEPDDEKQLVGRFKQEIQDIANYSGAKRVEIVAGWKKSQIYHTYIEMGNDSIQQGKPIGDIMSWRKASGKPYLTENQFHAVSEVSRLLLR